MRFADAFGQNLIARNTGGGTVIGPWEERDIDYSLFKLHEERRWKQIQNKLVEASLSPSSERIDGETDISPHVVSLGGVLVPRNGVSRPSHSSFVKFTTSLDNLRNVAQTLWSSKSSLLVGPSGAGKTAIIREIANEVGMLSSMLTLHLNDQTDAKSLLGIYTSSTSGAGFTWQPGVLTKAVQEGRWVLIEDIDRAPAEVMGLLRPLIESNELFLPSRKERLRPKDGFRIFGTLRSTGWSAAAAGTRNAFLSNQRLWNVVEIAEYSRDEVSTLLRQRYANLEPFIVSIMAAHTRIVGIWSSDPAFKAFQSRLPSIRDLTKWCRRLSRRLSSSVTDGNRNLIPETFMIDMLKDGIDCYVAHLTDVGLFTIIGMIMAECLNVAPSAAEHAFKHQNPVVQEHKSTLQVGRSSIPRLGIRRSRHINTSKFALTRQVRQNMEAIASAVVAQEPLLLVGETGVGKTTILQHIASSIDQKLTVVNLSNQSEASDLLGGLKPVTTRSLVVPLLDEFNELFDRTFSAGNNGKFRDSIAKAFTKQRWPRLVGHWEEAVQLAMNNLPVVAQQEKVDEQAAKRRKLDQPKYQALRERWATFANNINQVKAQMQRGEQNQIFAFVESRLVQAVRNGDWLLLDEINLASPETLDNILSLLHSGDDEVPYLLLAEAGSIERVNAHPNFRLFAAMNPATDTGKKDLPMAVRAHFTEIFVRAGDSDVNDLTEVVQVYLTSALDNDKRAATDLAKAYLAMKQLNAQHKLTDGAGDLPHFSLRSLTRCLQYVQQHSASHGLRRAMHEGMQMSFFTVLDLKSQRVALPVLEQHLVASPQAKRALQSQKPKISIDQERFIAFEHYAIVKGSLPSDVQSHYIVTGSVRRNLTNLARAASMRRFPVLLQGPTSAGKTSMVEYLAKYTGNVSVRINNHEHTDLQEYLGSYASGADGKLEYREGVLVEALRKGHWIVLDELNLAPSDVLEALNRLLDDNRELLIPESQEIVRPHPNFMLFATQNPAGLYGGRKRLSRAFRNRFLEIHVDDIPEDELEVILKGRTQIAPSFCRQIVEVYKKLSLQRQSSRLFEARNSFATLRDLFRWASRPVDDREQLAYHGFMLLAERVRDPAEKSVVKATIEETLKVKIDDSALYSEQSIPSTPSVNNKITWTRAMRRLFVLVSTALKNNEPVLLVGETGCGKTQICQCIAEAFGKHLNIYNAHSNTETGDLIGSQRPIRHKSELAKILIQNFQALGPTDNAMQYSTGMDVDDLIRRFKTMDTSEWDQQAVVKVKNSIAAYQSLFVWSDGSLVRAMKEGSHFLLDEISLADDSVLERMNSLLEPARSVLLAEKGVEDNFVVAKPGFQFLATMNPGGDYGKRELSAALRNRLTEIWVPPLSDSEDVMPILQNRLQSVQPTLAPPMIAFADYFRAEIQGLSNAAIPLRTLLSWAEFVVSNASSSLERAIVHGAAMTFIDSLGANPAGLASSSRHDIQQARGLCLRKLGRLFRVDATAIYYTLPTLQMAPDILRIGTFALPRLPTASSQDELVLDVPTTLRNTMRTVRALQTSRPLLLEGNPGVGKTAIVSSLARLCGRPLSRVNLSDQTDLMDLFGADAPAEGEGLGNFIWRDGPLLRAMQAGHWVLLDEMNLASQSVLEGLNACLDHRQEVYIAELDRTFKCHPDFTLFATQNPHHQGGGRKGLPASFVNRFTVVYADPFVREDLLQICRTKYPSLPGEWINNIVVATDDCQAMTTYRPEFAEGGPWEVNLRDLNRWMRLCQQATALDPSMHFNTIVAGRFRSEAAKCQALALSQNVFGRFEGESLYHNLSELYFQVGTAFMKRDAMRQHVVTEQHIPKALLTAAKATMIALDQNWPIILAGPSGSGKTSLIRSLAALSGARLTEFSMNADVDTADLIGGYEQYDVQREIAALQVDKNDALIDLTSHLLTMGAESFRKELSAVMSAYNQVQRGTASLNTLLSTLHNMPRTSRALTPKLIQDKLQAIHRKLEHLHGSPDTEAARFVWNDGILIDALRTGTWLVLDNANLCNPSVLDRLNSLLEPNGCLVLSEQHGGDGVARVIKPHRNFRIILTMDPKYGELSRAMRNRSLEIYLSTQIETSRRFGLPQYPTASTLGRLRPFLTEDVLFNVASGTTEELEPWMDQLDHSDLVLLRQQHDREVGAAREEAEIRLNMKLPKKLSQRAMEHLPSGLDTTSFRGGKALPAMLAVNEPLVPFLFGTNYRSLIAQETRMQSLSVVLIRCLSYLKDVAEGKCNNGSQTWLVRTSPQYSKLRRDQAPPIPAFSFMQALALFASSMMKSHHSSQEPNFLVSKPVSDVFRDITMLLLDLLHFFNQSNIDPSHIQAYLRILDDMKPRVAECFPRVSEDFVLATKKLGDVCQLENGQSLQRMWPTWKAKSATSAWQLEAQLTMEKLVARFDTLCKSLPHSRVQLADVRLRLVQALEAVPTMDDAMEQVEILTNAINELASERAISVEEQGHFEPVFDALLQKAEYHATPLPASTLQLRVLFGSTGAAKYHSNRATISPPMGLLSSLSDFTAMYAEISHKQALPPSEIGLQDIAFRLHNVHEQPLGRMIYAQEEISELVKAFARHNKNIANNSLEAIRTSGVSLLRQILGAHSFLLSEKSRWALSHDTSNRSSLASVFKEAIQDAERKGFASLNKVIKPLKVACNLLAKPWYPETGKALLIIANVCLKLFVPDRVFDPATYPLLVRGRHGKRTGELNARIEAWQDFQMKTTGQATSLIISLLKDELTELGEAPAAPDIYRPEPSQMDNLQNEFTNLLRNVVDSGLVEQVADGDWDDVKSGTPQLLSRVQTCVRRLSETHRAYDDLVKPVAGLLHCMALGARLTLYGVEQVMEEQGRRHISLYEKSSVVEHRQWQRELDKRVVSMQMILKNTRLDQESLGPLRTPQLWTYLKQLKLSYLIGRPQGAEKNEFLTHVADAIDQLYMLWRQKLGQDREEADKQSRYYSYRSEDELKEPSEEDVAAMFPKHESEDTNGQDNDNLVPGQEMDGYDSDDDPDGTNIDVRQTAVKLARWHRSLFKHEDHDELLRTYLRGQISVLDETYVGFKPDEMLSPETMPGLFLCFESKLKALTADTSHAALNIYTDSDVSETRKLFEITTNAQIRFREIAERWPEHTVPAEVLAFCGQVMKLKMSDPVAKLLTKTQKLLEITAQWQAVASKEFSAANIIDSLTNLIIHWRRLELGSWSRLLDEEDKKQQEDADAWYFIAYESVVYTSLMVVQDAAVGETEQSLDEYPQKLAKTLEEYLSNTTLGQYSSRLELLRAFAETLNAVAQKHFDEDAAKRIAKDMSKLRKRDESADVARQSAARGAHEDRMPDSDLDESDEDAERSDFDELDDDTSPMDDEELDFIMPKDKRGEHIMIIRNTVMNVVNHYSRYDVHVSMTLKEGRSALEKNITEQIKLASWKDTNITALRESARRSHFKLFKIVKKYRALLGQPVTSFGATSKVSTELPFSLAALSGPTVSAESISTHVNVCAQGLADWHERPDRLKNPLGAARTMRHVYTSRISEFLPSSELSGYLEDISSSAQELRKATPSILTDDNTSLIRDLKQRKRRLLADTMKDAAQMGIRRNLGTADLSVQSSTAAILARTPALSLNSGDVVSQAADEVFHELVDTLVPARQAALEHSDELTDGETRRGLGFLEGYFNLALKQRGQLGSMQRQLKRFTDLTAVLDTLHTSLQNGGDDSLLHLQSGGSSPDQLSHCLAWLPVFLEVYAGIADFQAGQGALELGDIVSSMRRHGARLRAQRDKLQDLPAVPPGLRTRQRHEIEEEATVLLRELKQDVERWAADQPQVEYIMLQIRKWLEAENDIQAQTNGHTVLNRTSIDQDLVFVALQKATEALGALPSSTVDPGWLVKTTNCHGKAIEALRLDALSNTLETLLHSLHKTDGEGMKLSISLLIVASPTIQQLSLIVQDLHYRMLHLHVQTCRLAVFLGKTFTTLAKEGFCSPSQPSDGQEQTGKVEQGTGLGEGDAAEDISKDVGVDEDLTDLAQEGGQREDGDEQMDKSKDAVDMGAEELEGEMGSGDEQATDEERESGDEDGEEQEMDEETGDVDDLDPSAVDEKMWDDMQKEAEKEEKEMKSQKAQGQKSEDQAARQEGQTQEENDDVEANEGGDGAEQEQEDADAQQQAEGENVDPHLQEEQALDVPDDMQLNGEEEKGDEISDAGMDDLSDVGDDNQAEDKQDADLPDEGQVERDNAQDIPEDANGEREEEVEGQAQDTDVVEDQPFDSEETKDEHHDMRQEDMAANTHDQENGEAGVANTNQADLDAQMDDNAPQGQNDVEAAAQVAQPQQGARSSKQEQSGTDQGAVEQGIGRQEDAPNKQNETLKKLADVLERYHQRREIFTANEERQQKQADQDVDMADADFQHLNGEKDEAEAQALGTANQDTTQDLNQEQAIEDKRAEAEDNLPTPEDKDERMADVESETLAQKMTRMQDEHEDKDDHDARNAVLPDSARERPRQDIDTEPMAVEDKDRDEVEAEVEQLENDLAKSMQLPTSTAMADAQHLWSLTSNKTQSLSLMLTEQLRLILQPTTATKLRGDFRTGKRLNIRRIIPYIASGYKRDKIWMRRSVPSKRNYQVMLAVDDSKSMAESGADILALETLCMLSRSLSMLEAGELSIVAFGKDYNDQSASGTPQAVKVAHPFSAPFSPSTSGPETFSNFTFNQTGTNIRALLSESISLFQDARTKSSAREAADLWQLQIIISDGHIGSDSDDSVRRLVRRAREEKIMSVFVVVDNSEESIVDLKEVVFEKDPADENGEMKVRTKRYLEGFPFQYYVVVREVRDLPGVLGRVLKGWFEGVVESG
ncbi:AAA ATPase midasin [Knufia fluminis]|uniref:Midasin n=2 Tax=Knufia TaxID=430999 RepID=A0AAN8EIJ2_9EURO|nr:AAA ATPase midasin [Knufia fluminis]